jgi:hypothetical protein
MLNRQYDSIISIEVKSNLERTFYLTVPSIYQQTLIDSFNTQLNDIALTHLIFTKEIKLSISPLYKLSDVLYEVYHILQSHNLNNVLFNYREIYTTDIEELTNF